MAGEGIICIRATMIYENIIIDVTHPRGGNVSSATTCASSKYRTLTPHTSEVIEDMGVLNDFKRDSGERVYAKHVRQLTSANQLHVGANHGSAYRRPLRNTRIAR